MTYYICWNGDDLYNLDVNVEMLLKEARAWDYYIEVVTPKKPNKKGVCLGSVTLKDN